MVHYKGLFCVLFVVLVSFSVCAYVRRVMWCMLYVDDACIVSRSPHGLAKIMEVIVEVCRSFALTVSVKKTEIICIAMNVDPPPGTLR